MNLPKRSSFETLLNVYSLSKIILRVKVSYFSLENAHDWLFSSAAVLPQSKSTELCSSAAIIPRSKSTEM